MKIAYHKKAYVTGQSLTNTAFAILNDEIKDFLVLHDLVQKHYYLYTNKDSTFIYLNDGGRIEVKH